MGYSTCHSCPIEHFHGDMCSDWCKGSGVSIDSFFASTVALLICTHGFPQLLGDFLGLRHATHFWQQIIVFAGRGTAALRVKLILFLQSVVDPGHERHEFLILRCLAQQCHFFGITRVNQMVL